MLNKYQGPVLKRLKRILLIAGIGTALLILIPEKANTQTVKRFVCAPCGCTGDTEVVHAAGKCGTCGMSLIDLNNPSSGLKYTNIWAPQLCTILSSNETVLLLDVRSKEEFNAVDSRLGRFKNAINIPITEINERIEELVKYKDKEIIVYCSISARSTRVSNTLSARGFTHVHNLMGGLNYWVDQPQIEVPCKNDLLQKNNQ